MREIAAGVCLEVVVEVQFGGETIERRGTATACEEPLAEGGGKSGVEEGVEVRRLWKIVVKRQRTMVKTGCKCL